MLFQNNPLQIQSSSWNPVTHTKIDHSPTRICRLQTKLLPKEVPVATFVMAVICGTDKLRCDVFLNMLMASVGVVISSYGEIHFSVIGTASQVTGIFAEALRLVLTHVLLEKKGLTLNPITSLYYIAPCSFLFLFVPWYLLEQPTMVVSQIQFILWIFLKCTTMHTLALNFSIFLVIGRTGVVTVRIAGVLKDGTLIGLSTIIFPESTITGLNVLSHAIALVRVVIFNYLKARDVLASNQIYVEGAPERAVTKANMRIWFGSSTSRGLFKRVA